MFLEFGLAFLERNGIYNSLSLQAFQAGFDHFPFGGVDHERDFDDFRFAAEQEEKAGHGWNAIDHAFVHADIDDVGAVFDLLTGDGDSFVVFIFLDQLGELGRAGDVGAFANHDEIADLLGEGLRAAQAQGNGCAGG